MRPSISPLREKRQSTQMLVIPSHFPQKRCPALKITLYFLLLIVPLPHPSSYKSLSFCTAPWSILLVARLDTEQIMNGLVKPTRSSNLPGWILFFLTKVKLRLASCSVYLIDRYMLSMLSLKEDKTHTLLFFFNLYFINKLERNFKKIDQGIPRER